MIQEEGGYTLAEMVVVIAILGIVVGGLVTLFASGITADADQTARFHAQQDARVALDKMRREIHTACTVSNPSTYNTAESSVTIYVAKDSCESGSNSVTWCTTGSGQNYTLYRIVATSCTGATQKFASNLTSGAIFTYLPPDSYVTSLGAGASGIVTSSGSSTLPRLHVDLIVNRRPSKTHDRFELVDDIAFRNGPRSCDAAGSC